MARAIHFTVKQPWWYVPVAQTVFLLTYGICRLFYGTVIVDWICAIDRRIQDWLADRAYPWRKSDGC